MSIIGKAVFKENSWDDWQNWNMHCVSDNNIISMLNFL